MYFRRVILDFLAEETQPFLFFEDLRKMTVDLIFFSQEKC